MTAIRAPWVGQVVADGRYRVLGLLGEGGMASVFRAVDVQRNDEVVLKVPKPALLADGEFAHRFAREVRTLVELRHPSIVSVLGFARHDGIPFAVLEYLSAGTLETHNRPCRLKDLYTWLPDVAAALDHIHAAGYVHRDVKPGNILFDAKGKARLTDFGIVKSVNENADRQTQALTESGVTVGTPEYMAPELAKGQAFDGRVDQYALAVTVYEMLAGRRPIEGGTGPVILVKQIREKPAPLDQVVGVTPALAAAVAKALAKDPNKRFGSCLDFVRAVKSSGSSTPMPTRTIEFTAPVADTSSWKLPAIIGGFLTFILMCGVILLFALRGNATAVKTPAVDRANQSVVETPPVPAGPLFRLALSGTAQARPGRPAVLKVAIERLTGWSGPVQLQIASDHGGVTGENITVAADDNVGNVPLHVAANVKSSAKLTVTASGGGSQQTLVVPLEIKSGDYTVQQPDDVTLVPDKNAAVSLFITRDGWDDDINLRLVLPIGVTAEPAVIQLARNVNEIVFQLRGGRNARPGIVRLVDAGTDMEKARFHVRMGAAPPTDTAGSVRVVGRMTAEAVALCFHPKDDSTLYAWTRNSQLQVWNTASNRRESVHSILGIPTRGTVSPEGKKVVTVAGTRVTVHNEKGAELTKGDLRFTILGVYYEGGVPYFWTRGGVSSGEGRTVRPESVPSGISSIRYASSGSRVSLRVDGAGVTWREGAKSVFLVPPHGVVDANVNHDGKWVVVATPTAVLVYDATIGDTPVWIRDVTGVTAVAINPDGRTVAASAGRELRLYTVTPKN